MSQFVAPTVGRVSSQWGWRTHPVTKQKGNFHRGIDIAAPIGTPVRAAYGGTVKAAWRSPKPNSRGVWPGNPYTGTWNTGNLVIIDGPGGGSELYGHLNAFSVKAGQKVKSGDIIGTVGNTGNVTGPHLHFECWNGRSQGSIQNGPGSTRDPRYDFAKYGITPGQPGSGGMGGGEPVVSILPRSAWTSTNPGFPNWASRLIKPGEVTHLRLHYPGDGTKSRAGLSQSQVASLLRSYREYHVGTRGWADIGYPYAVDQAGRAWTLAGHTHAAAHSATSSRPNENMRSMAFLLVLGDNEKPSSAMISTVNRLWGFLLNDPFPNMRTVTDHSQVPGATTRCAGPQVRVLLSQKAFKPITEGNWIDMASPEEVASAVWGYSNPNLEKRDAYALLRSINANSGPITEEEIRRFWVHNHPSDPSTDMRGYMVSTYRKTAEVEATQAGLVGALNAVKGGEPFNEEKLLEGVRRAAKEGVASAIDSIDTTVTISKADEE